MVAEVRTAGVLVIDKEAVDAVTDGVALDPAKCVPREANDEETAEITELMAVEAKDASGTVLVAEVDVLVLTGF